MTADEYIGKSNAQEIERKRIRKILDAHAKNKSLGSRTGDDAPLIKKTLKELKKVTEEALELEREFWGELMQSIDG